MQRRIGRGALYLALGIFLLFLLRLGYGYLSPGTRGAADASDGPGMSTTRNNYASEKMVVKRSMRESYDVSQKYEKIASIRSRTSRFEQDEKRLRAMTTRYEALIQFERSTGLPGRRALQVAIGVPPEKFDAMVAELRSIGEIASIRIDKSDRTNEFKELNARRVSLEKARDALGALKERGGGIDESINLEDKILQIEE